MHDDYLAKLSSFIDTQSYLAGIGLDALRKAKRRDELGITSLSIIMLVANYMEACGLSGNDFHPEWIVRLDEMEGIVSVFKEIDAEAMLATA